LVLTLRLGCRDRLLIGWRPYYRPRQPKPLLEGIGVSLRRGRGASPQTAIENLLVDGVLPAHSPAARPFLIFAVFAFFLFVSFATLVWTFGLRH
jgi:hypothetical protein